MDQWSQVPEILSRAYGEDEAAKIIKAGRAAVVHSETAVYSLIDDLQTNLSKMPGGQANYVTVTVTEVKPEKQWTYRHLISKYKAAEKKQLTPSSLPSSN